MIFKKNVNFFTKYFLFVSLFFISILTFSLFAPGIQAKSKKRSIPKAKRLKFQTKYFKLYVYSRRFAQGDGVYFKIIAKTKTLKTPKLKFLGKFVPIVKNTYKGQKYFDGLAGISPIQKTGTKRIRVYFYPFKSKGKVNSFKIKIRKTHFLKKYVNLKINKKYTQPPKKNYKLIAKLRKIKRKAFALRTARKWNGRFIDPRNLAKITSPFYTIRYYNGKAGSPHSGVDLRGKTGDPIRAMNSGKIVIARKFYYEGNFTVIDHGEGVFTFYMHQSKLLVHEGQMVKRGQLIGLAGGTGMVTAAHLHLGFKIRHGIYSPLSFLTLPILKH